MASQGIRSKTKRVLVICGIILAALIAVSAIYVADYYRADSAAQQAMTDADGAADGVTVRTLEDGSIAFEATQPRAGLIFYPGGKVQPEAYAPLLTRFAQDGITSILVKPPLNLAFFDIDAADGISARYPEISQWMLAGHSLGGVAASLHLADHADEYDGIVLLASYSTADLSDFDGEVILIRGSNDGVLNREKYEEAKENLPEERHEYVIEGGNHASFGDYGAQRGDGSAQIPSESQQEQTADIVASVALAD